jgi:hypothetical protein
MPFLELWGRFDRILMVRKQRFSTEIYISVVLNGRTRILLTISPVAATLY